MALCPPGPVTGPAPQYDIAQEREFYKYFQPIKLGLAAHSEKRDHTSPLRPRASPDRALTAFAQLATLRLNCKRAFISFFDRTHQYLVAEATQTLSLLQTEFVHKPDDALHYGVAAVPKKGSICEHTLGHILPLDVDEKCNDGPVFVVPDLRADERFKNQPYTTEHNWVFYAGVPIVSPNGFKIGAYCVVDDKPRNAPTPEEIAFLKDMSTTVMVHMDMLRAQSESIKGERMVRGLGSFVEGKSSLEDWWMNPDGQGSDQDQDFTDDSTSLWADRQYSMHHDGLPGEAKNDEQSSSLADVRVRLDIEKPPSRRTSQASSTEAVKPTTFHEDPKAKKTSATNNLAPEVKATFGRASQIIREAMQIDAVIIFDAQARSTFGGLVDQATHERPKRRKLSSASETSLASSDVDSSGSDSEGVALKSEGEDNKAEILGYSMPGSSSLYREQTVRITDSMSESFLRSLLRRYPHGKVLNFDEQDQTSQLQSSGQYKDVSVPILPERANKKRKRLRLNEAKAIRDMFPGVRSLAIVPQWDSQQKFFSACIAWTVDPHRILTTQDLSYFAAFSDCTMSEVARINAKIADKAKSDFISSISHELRSPLHGILGSVECLQDSTLDPFQENLVHTMETCGKTLLDTIDHLLDFAKINNFTRKSSQRRTNPSDPQSQKQNFALDVDVDLSVITEEVLETVFAGYDFVRAGRETEEMPNTNTQVEGDGSLSAHKRDVSIVVDISKAVDSHWIFRTQAGAWRRVLMNLFGNSLKYTEQGFIQVRLDSEPLPYKNQAGQSKVILSVTDSGKGMSKEYLDKHLFTPFAQEDSMQPGTGLGLAITKAIITSMGGEIDVKSEKDKGTQITVSLRMMHAPKSQDDLEQSVISSAAKITKGLKIGFIGFDANSSEEEPRPDTRSPDNAYHRFMSSFHRMCQNWFKMDMEIMHGLDQADSDVFLTTEKGLAEVQDQLDTHMKRKSDKDAQDKVADTPLLVICNSVSAANAMMHDPKSHVSGVLSQPCGPRKLAKALTLCLESHKHAKTPGKAMPSVRKILNDGLGEDEDLHDSLFQKALESAKKADKEGMVTNNEAGDAPLKHPRAETLEIPQGRSRVPKVDTAVLGNSTSPSSPAPIQSSSPSTHSSPEPNKRICKVLLVDDNKINLQLLVTYLKKSGHAFMTANNGLEALETYKAQSQDADHDHKVFDFILMDLSMPVMDGLTSTRHIRAHERANKIKPATVIALTGLASADAQQEAFSSGVDTFMTKPVKLKELGKMLDDDVDSGGGRSNDRAGK